MFRQDSIEAATPSTLELRIKFQVQLRTEKRVVLRMVDSSESSNSVDQEARLLHNQAKSTPLPRPSLYDFLYSDDWSLARNAYDKNDTIARIRTSWPSQNILNMEQSR